MRALSLLLLFPLLASAQPRRLAVVVGANRAAVGRNELRYAYRDAQSLADTLIAVGGFRAEGVQVLRDPKPDEVLAALDSALVTLSAVEGESLLLFYYSGHADRSALYPGGSPLPLEALRKRLATNSATVRLGVIDACSGGGWTRAKGLSVDAPFEVDVPLGLATSEGSALISSSSGGEAAHETDAFLGSFFTHHFVAGLRGAADQSGDGEVTLSEAFAYARELTVRDTALQTAQPQHPSFDLQLRGRSDLPLTRVGDSSSLLSLEMTRGPLQLVHLQTGVVVLELAPGARRLLLAVPPGRYVLRRATAEGVWGSTVNIEADQSAQLHEDSLVASVKSPERKAVEPPPFSSLTTVPRYRIQLRALGGFVGHPAEQGGILLHFTDHAASPGMFLDIHAGITSRLQLQLAPWPVFSYRFGNRGGVEWVPFLGIPKGGLGFSPAGVSGSATIGTGLSTRFWFAGEIALNAGVGVEASFLAGPGGATPPTWTVDASFGASTRLASRVTVNVALAWRQNALVNGTAPPAFISPEAENRIGLGSVQTVGMRKLALISVSVLDWLAIELHGSTWVHVSTQLVETNALLGVAVQFL